MRFAIKLMSLVMFAASAFGQTRAMTDWANVIALNSGTPIHVSARHRRAVCEFVSAEENSVTCERTREGIFHSSNRKLVFARTDVQTIKLPRRHRSALVGGLIGIATGAAIGAALQSSTNDSEQKVADVFLPVLIGGALGAGLGSASDFTAGPVIYQAP